MYVYVWVGVGGVGGGRRDPDPRCSPLRLSGRPRPVAAVVDVGLYVYYNGVYISVLITGTKPRQTTARKIHRQRKKASEVDL
jgi:hypothetical protein